MKSQSGTIVRSSDLFGGPFPRSKVIQRGGDFDGRSDTEFGSDFTPEVEVLLQRDRLDTLSYGVYVDPVPGDRRRLPTSCRRK
jgi:hypothetical protein